MIDKITRVSYEAVASEYYDTRLHLTCVNFREASRRFLMKWLQKQQPCAGYICEVGTGRSLLAEALLQYEWPLHKIVLIDSSATMLGYSREWLLRGPKLLVGAAESLPLRSGVFDMVASFLGDPYNHHAFWQEVTRVLRPAGIVIFTTPSYEWALQFRGKKTVIVI